MKTPALRQPIIKFCGFLALLGCLLVSLGDVAGAIVAGHNPISETISKLAIGEHAWIQDLGLDAYAVGVAALSFGLFLRIEGDVRWHAGLALLVALSVNIFLIAEHNQYAGRPGRGAAIHIYLVYILYGLVALIPILLAKEVRYFGQKWRTYSYTFASLWLVLAPFFFLVPDWVNGAYERFLALFLVFGAGALGYKLFQTQQQGKLLRGTKTS